MVYAASSSCLTRYTAVAEPAATALLAGALKPPAVNKGLPTEVYDAATVQGNAQKLWLRGWTRAAAWTRAAQRVET